MAYGVISARHLIVFLLYSVDNKEKDDGIGDIGGTCH